MLEQEFDQCGGEGVTEDVGDETRPAEPESSRKDGAGECTGQGEQAGDRGPTRQGPTAGEDPVVQWPADGCLAVAGHGCEQEALPGSQEVEKQHLGKTRAIGQGPHRCHQVSRHPRHRAGDGGSVQQREVGSEAVRGSVKPGVHHNEAEDAQVPNHSHHAEQQKDHKDQGPRSSVSVSPSKSDGDTGVSFPAAQNHAQNPAPAEPGSESDEDPSVEFQLTQGSGREGSSRDKRVGGMKKRQVSSLRN